MKSVPDTPGGLRPQDRRAWPARPIQPCAQHRQDAVYSLHRELPGALQVLRESIVSEHKAIDEGALVPLGPRRTPQSIPDSQTEAEIALDLGMKIVHLSLPRSLHQMNLPPTGSRDTRLVASRRLGGYSNLSQTAAIRSGDSMGGTGFSRS